MYTYVYSHDHCGPPHAPNFVESSDQSEQRSRVSSSFFIGRRTPCLPSSKEAQGARRARARARHAGRSSFFLVLAVGFSRPYRSNPDQLEPMASKGFTHKSFGRRWFERMIHFIIDGKLYKALALCRVCLLGHRRVAGNCCKSWRQTHQDTSWCWMHD